jgi:hypothetical protein
MKSLKQTKKKIYIFYVIVKHDSDCQVNKKGNFRSFVFFPISVLTIKKKNYIFSKQINRRKTNDKQTNKM